MDDHGFVQARHFQSDAGHVVSLRTFGLHISTTPLDAGLSLGWTAKTYFFPSAAAASAVPRAPIPWAHLGEPELGGLTEVALEDAPSIAQLGKPLAFASRSAGLMLHTGTNAAGISLGLRSQAAVHVPKAFDGLIVVAYDGADTGRHRLLVLETP